MRRRTDRPAGLGSSSMGGAYLGQARSTRVSGVYTGPPLVRAVTERAAGPAAARRAPLSGALGTSAKSAKPVLSGRVGAMGGGTSFPLEKSVHELAGVRAQGVADRSWMPPPGTPELSAPPVVPSPLDRAAGPLLSHRPIPEGARPGEDRQAALRRCAPPALVAGRPLGSGRPGAADSAGADPGAVGPAAAARRLSRAGPVSGPRRDGRSTPRRSRRPRRSAPRPRSARLRTSSGRPARSPRRRRTSARD